jgi:hypothetical protein
MEAAGFLWAIRGLTCVVLGSARPQSEDMVDVLLLVAGFTALPLIGRIIRDLIELFVRLVVGTFTLMFFALVFFIFVIHGR